MQVTRKNISPTSVSLTITADEADLKPLKNHVLGHFSASVKVPGFREGTAPPAMVERYVNQQTLLDDFMEHALNQFYGMAIDHEKVRPAGRPEVNVKKFVPYSTLEFEAAFDIIGPIKLPDYKKIKLAKQKPQVSADEIKNVLESLQQRGAHRKAVDRAAKIGDEVVIDFKGTDEQGQSIAGADGQDYPLILGSGNFIPGFEDKMVGLKAGENERFKITFPADYHAAALRSKPVSFDVTVKTVNELSEAKIDDKFASTVGPFKTVAELKADIKKQLTAEKQQAVDRQYEEDLLTKIADKAVVDVPKTLVDEQIAAAEEREKSDLIYRGQTWEEHLKAEGITEEEHRERQRPDSERRVKIGLMLGEIAEAEKIEVTPEELEIRLQILKSQYQDPQMQAEIDKPDNRRDTVNRMITEKTVAKLVAYASK